MGIIQILFGALVAGALIGAVIYIAYLTVKELKKLIQKQMDKKKEGEVIFVDKRKILEEVIREKVKNAQRIKLEELEEECETEPYVTAIYNPDTEEISDIITIKTDRVDEKIDELLWDSDGIIIFD